MRASFSSRSSIEWAIPFFMQPFSLNSDLSRFQVLSYSIGSDTIRNRCLHGLQIVSSRCGILPKSHWIAQSSLPRQDVAFSTTRKVSDARKRSTGGGLVVVRTVNPDYIGDFDVFNRVRLIDSSKRLSRV